MKLTTNMWQRKIQRKIYGPIKDQNLWRIWTNDELQVMYRKPNILTTIKVRRLEWAGHLVGMSDARTAKTMWRTGFGRGYGPVVRQTTEEANLHLSIPFAWNMKLSQWITGTDVSTQRLVLIFSTLPWNIGAPLSIDSAAYLRRKTLSATPLRRPQNLHVYICP
jgi:hypothetical protein